MKIPLMASIMEVRKRYLAFLLYSYSLIIAT